MPGRWVVSTTTLRLDAVVGSPLSTESLFGAAGVAYAKGGGKPGGSGGRGASTKPTLKGLRTHVSTSCTGTGVDGNRIRPLYVREQSAPSRYEEVLPLLRNELANVDDVIAVSSRKTGGDLRVRWVLDQCEPVISEVVVPDGATASFGATVQALQALGFSDPARKNLAFVDAYRLCGVATYYNTDAAVGNLNDGVASSYARIDTGCWSGSTSTPAHELIHMLGGIMGSAPHSTPAGHCSDDGDLMCYADAPGVVMRPDLLHHPGATPRLP